MKLVPVISAFALMLTFGCNNQPAAEQAEVVEKEKETVRVVEVEKPAKETVTVTAPAPAEKERETSIRIGESGGSVKTKKVDISVGN